MNEQDVAMATLMDAVAPQETQTEQNNNPVEGEQIEQQTQEPQATENTQQVPMELQALMQSQNSLAQNIQSIQEQLSNNTQNTIQEPLSDEDQAIEELVQKLGISNITNENAQLKQTVESLQNMMQQQQLQNDISSFKTERPNADENAIMDYISTLPPEMQRGMDNPAGWRMIDDLISLKASAQQPSNTVIPSQTIAGQQDSTFDRMRKGESVAKQDIGAAILKNVMNR